MNGWCFREAHEQGTWLEMGYDLHPSAADRQPWINGGVNPVTTQSAPEQLQEPVNLKSFDILASDVSRMTRVGFEPTTYGLKVLSTARTASSNLSPTECERPTGLSVHVPKRPARNALSRQSHVNDNRRAILESPSATGNRMSAGNTGAEYGSNPHAVLSESPSHGGAA